MQEMQPSRAIDYAIHRLGYLIYSMVLTGRSIVTSLALVRPCLALFPLVVHAHVPSFHISYSFTIILVSAYSFYLTLAVPIREVSCV